MVYEYLSFFNQACTIFTHNKELADMKYILF